MKIPENRIYPYPMFSNIHTDYKDNSFDVDFEYMYDYNTVQFTVKTNIKNNFILKMMETGKFSLALHIDCTKTKFRKAYEIPYEYINKEYSIVIESEDLIGNAEVIFILVSTEDIQVEATDAFDDFYQGTNISFQQFAIVGFSDTYDVFFKKKMGINQQPSSIFNIIKAQVPYKRYNLENDVIAILLPENDYAGYIKLQGTLTRVKHTAFIEPALIYTLDKIKQDQDGSYCKKEWYKALDMSCRKIGIDIDSENFKEIDTYEIATQLLSNPYSDAINELNILLKED